MDMDVVLTIGNLLFLIVILFFCKRYYSESSLFSVQQSLPVDAQCIAKQQYRMINKALDATTDGYSLKRQPCAAIAVKTPSLHLATEPFNEYAEFGFVSLGKANLSFRASRFGNSTHHHADQGNLALIDDGLGVLIPTGSYGYCFGGEQNNYLTRKTQAHNLPLIA